MAKKYEYDEGVRAKDNFESGMKALFRVPKDTGETKKPAKKRAKRSTGRRAASRDSEADAQTS